MILLDIAKLYDMVWKHRVLATFNKCKFNGNILKFINNFPTERTFVVKFENTLSSDFEIENGLHYGFLISVTLFLIAINDIRKYIKLPVKIILYAYDYSIYCT